MSAADDFAPALDDGRSEYADSFHRSLDSALERAGEVEALAGFLADLSAAFAEYLTEATDISRPGFHSTDLVRIAAPLLAARDAQITEAAEAAAGERIAVAIEAERNAHWQEHLKEHPRLGSARACPDCYAKHDAYYHAAAIARSVPATEAGEER